MLNQITTSIETRLLTWINVDRYLPLQLDIINSCNLRCIHCYHPDHLNTNTLSLIHWKEIIDEYFALCKKLKFKPFILFCGGEPFLSKNLFPLIDYVYSKSKNIKTMILTNGTLIQEDAIKNLQKYPNLSIQISLDGASPKTHDSIRGEGQFNKSVHAINLLRKEKIPVYIQCVLSKKTEPQITEMFDLAKKLSVTALSFTRLIPEGYAKSLTQNNRDQPLYGINLKEAYIKILKNSSQTGVKTNTSLPLMQLIHPKLGRSGRFWEGIVINHQGKILASSRSRIVLGDVKKESLSKVFLSHPLLKSIRKGEIKECGQCRFIRQCGGDRNSAYGYSGNYLGKDPGCWIKNTKEKGNENE